nr:MAG TPA: hypothetical protein [Caudoviricetes sp.]
MPWQPPLSSFLGLEWERWPTSSASALKLNPKPMLPLPIPQSLLPTLMSL